MIRILAALLCALSVTFLAGPAFARPIVKLQLTASKSGRIVRYTIVATNSGSDAAFDLSPIGHIPNGTKIVPGSVHGASNSIEYTLDGKVWSIRPMIATKRPDGKIVMKPADPAAYTALRWHMKTPLKPHTTAAFIYEVTVK